MDAQQAQEVIAQAKMVNMTTDVLQECLRFMQSTKGFVEAEVPDVIKQYLKWGLAEYTFWAGIGLMISLICISLWLYIARHGHKLNDMDTKVLGRCIGVIGGVVGSVIFLCNFRMILMIYFAPKVYLINMFLSLVVPSR